MELKLSIAICESHHAAVVFKTKVLHFRVKNTPSKDKWKEEVQKNAQFSFMDKESFWFYIQVQFLGTLRYEAKAVCFLNVMLMTSRFPWGHNLAGFTFYLIHRMFRLFHLIALMF